MILQCIDGLRGDLHVTFEEGTSAAWLYDLLKPHVTELMVCDPRKNASMREDSQNDKIDARRLAELLRIVSHVRRDRRDGDDRWAIPCNGKEVYAACHRAEWLRRSRNLECAGGRSFTTSNWMR